MRPKGMDTKRTISAEALVGSFLSPYCLLETVFSVGARGLLEPLYCLSLLILVSFPPHLLPPHDMKFVSMSTSPFQQDRRDRPTRLTP